MRRSARCRSAAALGVVAVLALAPALAASPASAASVPTASEPPLVERIAGPNRYATAVALSQAAFPDGTDIVLLATGSDFPDALAGAPAVAGVGPVLLVGRGAIPDVTRAELRRLAPRDILVLGGPVAVSDTVLAEADRIATVGAVRISGHNRTATAATVARTAFDPGVPLAVVASAEDFPDALAGGALAGARSGPVLLTGRDRLPAETVAALRVLSPARIVVTGGPSRVGDAVLRELEGLTDGRVVRRSGPDRAATSAAVSREELRRSALVLVATGQTFPDALAAAAVAGPALAPVLLVTHDAVPASVRCELQRLEPAAVVIVGGDSAVAPAVERELTAGYPTGTGACSPSPEPEVPGGNGRVPTLPAAPALGYQLNATHDGTTSDGSTASTTLTRAWTAPLDGRLSFPVVADGRVFLTRTVPGSSAYGTEIVALDADTGQVVWRDRLAHTYYSSGLTYEAGTLYALGYDAPLQARDPRTGRVRWVSTAVSGSDTPPTAAGGRVFADVGGAVVAVDAATGRALWRRPVEGSGKSTPTVTLDGVFVSYVCSNTDAMLPATGQPLWQYRGECTGGGGRTTAWRDGLLYTRGSFGGNLVMDDATGAPLGVHPGDLIPALWEGGGVFVGGEQISGADTRGRPRWTLDDTAITAPVVANGAAYVATGDGRLLALDSRTGALLWSDLLPAPAFAPDEHNVSSPLAGLAVGEGLLVVPTQGGVVAYRADSAAAAAAALTLQPGRGEAATAERTEQLVELAE